MKSYQHPVFYTVEIVIPGGGNLVYEFAGDEHEADQARSLYKELTKRRGVMKSSNDHIDGHHIIGVNLVVWGSHPDNGDSKGLILAQQGWAEE